MSGNLGIFAMTKESLSRRRIYELIDSSSLMYVPTYPAFPACLPYGISINAYLTYRSNPSYSLFLLSYLGRCLPIYVVGCDAGEVREGRSGSGWCTKVPRYLGKNFRGKKIR